MERGGDGVRSSKTTQLFAGAQVEGGDTFALDELYPLESHS